MNHEQWEALKAATLGHTPGPWYSCPNNGDIETRDYILFVCHADRPTDNSTLAAAATDLLAEVERLRGWLDFISENPRGGHVTYVHAQNALDGAEVPK
jgi:hypothetical protein